MPKSLEAEAHPTIAGDVTVAPVTLNMKGGSLTAILPRAIRGAMTAALEDLAQKWISTQASHVS